jgi:hypothetical protein
MHPLLKELQKDNDPHDVLEITPDIVLAARADHELPTLAPGTGSRPSEPSIHVEPIGAVGASAPSLDGTFRADNADRVPVAGERTRRRKWATRALVAFLFALGSGAAAEGWRHYGDTARQMIAHWTPWTVATSSPPANPAPSEQPTSPDAQDAVATAAPAQAAPSAPSPVAAASASVPSPDQAPSLQSMAQQIEQLKASIEQLKAGQEQMARDIAKSSEAKAAVADLRASDPNLRPRIVAPRLPPPPPHAVIAQPARKPRPTFTAVQTAPPPPLPPAAAAPAPLPVEPPPQATVETDGNPVVRPPMPLR